MIQEAGDYLKGQLPDHPNHPKGRNPYAHVALCIKNKFSNSYKDIEDENINEVEGENLEKKVEQLNSAIADVRKQLEELGQ